MTPRLDTSTEHYTTAEAGVKPGLGIWYHIVTCDGCPIHVSRVHSVGLFEQAGDARAGVHGHTRLDCATRQLSFTERLYDSYRELRRPRSESKRLLFL